MLGAKSDGDNKSLVKSNNWRKKYIPNVHFYETEFDGKKLEKESPLPKKYREDLHYKKYLRFLEDYISSVKSGVVPNKSYYIYAPDRFGKMYFAHTVIKYLWLNGKKTTPLLSVYNVYSQLYRYEYLELNEEIKDKDLILLHLSPNPPVERTRIVINYLLSEGEKMGIPVIVIAPIPDYAYSVYGGFNTKNPCANRTKVGELGKLERQGFTKELATLYSKEYDTPMRDGENEITKGYNKFDTSGIKTEKGNYGKNASKNPYWKDNYQNSGNTWKTMKVAEERQSRYEEKNSFGANEALKQKQENADRRERLEELEKYNRKTNEQESGSTYEQLTLDDLQSVQSKRKRNGMI